MPTDVPHSLSDPIASPRRVTLRFVILLVGIAIMACEPSVKGSVGYQPPVLPLQFSVDFKISPSGDVSVGGSVAFVTEIGRFSAGVEFGENTQPTPDELLLVIRVRSGGKSVDNVYRIASGDEIDVTVDGRTTTHVTNHKVVIDATDSSVRLVEVKNVPPPPVVQAPTRPSDPGKIALVRTILTQALQPAVLDWSPDGHRIVLAGSTGDSGSPTVSEVRDVETGGVTAQWLCFRL